MDRFRLGVSAATVRNEMGILEDAGYIYQPHTSAGRIPTDRGYRYFVDVWAGDGKLPADDARLVSDFFGEPRWELEDALRRTAALLSGMTDHAAVVFAPALDKSMVRHVELLRLSGDRAMVLLVTDTGRVENHVLLIPEALDDVQIDQTAEMLNKLVSDTPLEQVADKIRSTLDRFPLELRDAVATVAGALDEELPSHESGACVPRRDLEHRGRGEVHGLGDRSSSDRRPRTPPVAARGPGRRTRHQGRCPDRHRESGRGDAVLLGRECSVPRRREQRSDLSLWWAPLAWITGARWQPCTRWLPPSAG